MNNLIRRTWFYVLLLVTVVAFLFMGNLSVRRGLYRHVNNTSEISLVSGIQEAKPHRIRGEASRMCTQQERLRHMSQWCDKFSLARRALMVPSGRSIVDFKHRLLFCWMSKSGCTSLKAFIMEANGLTINEKSKGDSLNLVHFNNVINKYGVKQMNQLNQTYQEYVVKDFYTTFAIRHPFDRLVAYYRDKIVDTDRSSNHPKRVAEILHLYRPHVFKNNSKLSSMEFPQAILGPPTFLEFITWVYETKTLDEHWAFISECCHPCAHHWDAVLRVETMETDGRILADRLNVSYNNIPRRHSHEKAPEYNVFSKQLDHFKGVSQKTLDFLLDMFKVDMDMFGYRWDEKTNTAFCSIQTTNGTCC